MRPGLTRDPGLNILLPDLFFLPLASLPLKSTWEKNFLKRLKILGWGAAAAQGSGLGTGAPWSQRPGLIQVKGLLAFPHLIFSFPLPHLHLPHLHLPHLIPHSSLREWNPVRALFVLTRLQTPWGRSSWSGHLPSFLLQTSKNVQQTLPSPPALLSTFSSSTPAPTSDPPPLLQGPGCPQRRTMPRQDPSVLTPMQTQDVPPQRHTPCILTSRAVVESLLNFKSLHPQWTLTELGRAFLKIREDFF